MISKRKGTSVGTPGASAKTASSSIRKGFSKLSWKARLGLGIFGSVAGLIAALALGLNPLSGIAVLAAFTLFVSGLFVAPAIWGAISVLSLYGLIAIPYAGSVLSLVLGSRVTLTTAVEGGISLMTAALLSSWFIMRFSRTSVWKALAITLFGASIAAYTALAVLPSLGFNTVLIAIALFTLYYCGAKDWIVGGYSLLRDKLNKENSDLVAFNEVEEDAPLKNRASAEVLTANYLNEINSETIVYHDVSAKKSSAIPHVVISSTGVSLVHSAITSGHIYETNKLGLVVPGVDMSSTIATMLEQRAALAKSLKTREDAIQLVITVHSKSDDLEKISRTFAIYADSTGRKNADVNVVSGDELLGIVDTGLDLWSPVSQRAVARRAHFALKPAHLVSDKSENSIASDDIKVAAVDTDGRETNAPVSVQEAEATRWMLPGTPIAIETTQGMIADVVIAGELARNANSEIVYPVCAIEEWEIAYEEGREPEVAWILATNIYKDSAK
jgi:hypothetical protein